MSDLHPIERQQNEKNLTKILSRLSAPVLQRALGKEVFSGLRDFGFGTDNYKIAKTLVSIYSSEILAIKEIRENLCLNIDYPMFAWGRNKKSAKFLDINGLSKDFLPEEKIKREILFDSQSESPLHDYQQAVKSKLSTFLVNEDKKDSIMVQMPTGSGKTRVAMESIYDFIRLKHNSSEDISIIWLAHTDELCEQAIESFQIGWSKFGSFKVNIIRLWGGNIKSLESIPKGVNFAVISFQSAYSAMLTSHQNIEDLIIALRDKTKLLVVDEAHISKANTYETTINFLTKHGTKRVGLTATPGRHGLNTDNAQTLELASFYEDNKIDISSEFHIEDGMGYLQEEGILSSVTSEPLNTNFEIVIDKKLEKKLSEGSDVSKEIITQVANDKDRNNKIIKHLQFLALEKKKKILLFAASVSHANMLSAVLSATGIESRSITDKTSPQSRRAAIRDFKNNEYNVLCNFGVLSTGFDDPKIDCVVIARPTFSVVLYSQMVGRGLRGLKNGGTADCLLVDVVDNLICQPDLKQAYKFFEGEWNG